MFKNQRIKLIKAMVCLLSLLFFSLNSNAAVPPQVSATTSSIAGMLQTVTPSVVNILGRGVIQPPLNPFAEPGRSSKNSNPKQFESYGSGVIVDAKNGYILTNNHLLTSVDTITVTLSDGRIFKAKLIGADPDSDVAVLQIKADHLTQAALGNSDVLKVGDFVAAIGNPFGLTQTVTSGIVSALQRSGLGIEGYENFIQTDASINPGNSGGALVNMQGQLVGINTAILAPGGGNIGIGFAIPINMARAVMDQLIKYGSVRRGLIGVYVQELTPALANALHMPGQVGALVNQVAPNSLADKAGIKTGDVIQEVNGQAIKNGEQVKNVIGLLRVGSDVSIKVLRNGKTLSFNLTTMDPKQYMKTRETISPYLYGIGLKDFAQQTVNQGFIKGVQITATTENSAAWSAGLRVGDIIISANQTPITNVQQLRQIAQSSKQELLLNIFRPQSGGSAFVIVK